MKREPFKLVLELNSKKVPNRTGVYGSKDGGPVGFASPDVDEDYWVVRVPVSKTQAVVGFPKYFTIGIGFQHEKADSNVNLPFCSSVDRIYLHIEKNRDGASPDRCKKAIRMIQDAVVEHKLVEDSVLKRAQKRWREEGR